MDNPKVDEVVEYSDTEIFKNIWFSPREIFSYITKNENDSFTYILLFLVGINRGFSQAILKNSGDNLPLLAIVLISIIIGGLFGWISYYIFAALLSWTGEWLGGKGDTKSILRMLAYAMIPSILSLLLLIPQLSIAGEGLFQSNFDIFSLDLFSIYIYYISFFISTTLGIWSLVLYVIGLSEVQKFSVWKAIANILIATLVIIVPIMLIFLGWYLLKN